MIMEVVAIGAGILLFTSLAYLGNVVQEERVSLPEPIEEEEAIPVETFNESFKLDKKYLQDMILLMEMDSNGIANIKLHNHIVDEKLLEEIEKRNQSLELVKDNWQNIAKNEIESGQKFVFESYNVTYSLPFLFLNNKHGRMTYYHADMDFYNSTTMFTAEFESKEKAQCLKFPLLRFSNTTLQITMPSEIINYSLPKESFEVKVDKNILFAKISPFNDTVKEGEVCI